MKKLSFLFILLFLLLIGLTSCDSQNQESMQYDNLGGGGVAESGTLTNTSSESYIVNGIEELTDFSLNEEISGTIIDLETLTVGEYDGYTLSKKYKLTINKEGTYQLTGSFQGVVSVEALSGDVRIILNNVNITARSDQASAALVFKGSDTDAVGLRVLTVAEGSVNYLSDSSYNLDANDGDEAVIQAKKNATLTINGEGTLNLVGCTSETTGIKLKTVLNILNTKINIASVKNGIKANQILNIMNAKIVVNATNDGIKTDMEASTNDEAALFASSMLYGYLHIIHSSLDLTTGDDALVSNNTLVIENSEEDVISITTNNGAPSKITESSSDNANGKGIKVAGTVLVVDDVETDVKATYSDNYCLVICGGTFIINANDDAIHSAGNVIISGGTFNITTGDDGIHAEYITRISGGSILINNSYEGIEGATIEIIGGTINLLSQDDGINAANGEFKNYSFSLYITGGDIFVNAQGDGLDSNGTLNITGGNIEIIGPTNAGNGSLDADRGILVNGGNLVAVGSLGMVETPASNSQNLCISLNLSSLKPSGTTIKVLDSNKNVLYELTPNKQFQSVIISLEAFIKNATYTVIVGSDEYSVTLNSTINVLGSAGGFGPGGHGGPRR